MNIGFGNIKGKFIDWKKVVRLGKPFFNVLGNTMSDMIRDETTLKKQDVFGNKFKMYSEAYAERKAKGKFKRQSSREVGRPDLILTGDMMQDLQVRRATRISVKIGWTAVESSKIAGNASAHSGKPRIVTDDDRPVSNTVLAMSMNRMNRQIKRNIQKYASNKKLTIQMG